MGAVASRGDVLMGTSTVLPFTAPPPFDFRARAGLNAGTSGGAPLVWSFAAQIAATEVTLPPLPPRADLTSYMSASGSTRRGDRSSLGDFGSGVRGAIGDFGGASGEIGETEETGDTGRIAVNFGASRPTSAGFAIYEGVLESTGCASRTGTGGFVSSDVLREGAAWLEIAASTNTDGSGKIGRASCRERVCLAV